MLGDVSIEGFPFAESINIYTGVEMLHEFDDSVTMGIHAILRYTFLCHELKIKFKRNIRRWRSVNIAGLVLGMISSLGLLMVGCFQYLLFLVYLEYATF
ncbi:hypothetical protein KUTeg_023413 [Tegillarca granosa]|uniref:Uncharacterized protein n=1 Tax=Tegillarca granosa TaxID=220873 RepID=A0ABQ9E7R0_TEGGR|nr:hypothetical protein KUTeg_023413 [Tegillarca granosa]